LNYEFPDFVGVAFWVEILVHRRLVIEGVDALVQDEKGRVDDENEDEEPDGGLEELEVGADTRSEIVDIALQTGPPETVKPGFEVAYTFDLNDTQGTIIQPYAKADYIYDFTDLTNGDSGAMNLGGGLRLGNSARGLSGSIDGEKQVGRSDYTEYSISGLVAYGIALDGKNNPQTSVAEPYVKTSFTHQSQELGAGIKYSHGTLPFSAMADISQSFAPGVDTQGTTTFKVGAELQF